MHLARLVDLELLAAHRSAAGRYSYEPCFETVDGEPRLAGLADPAAFACDQPETPAGPDRSGSGRPPVGPPRSRRTAQRRAGPGPPGPPRARKALLPGQLRSARS